MWDFAKSSQNWKFSHKSFKENFYKPLLYLKVSVFKYFCTWFKEGLLWLLCKFIIPKRTQNLTPNSIIFDSTCCRANFLSIRPRIKFLFPKLPEIENYDKKNLNLASGAHFPTFFYHIQNGSSFYNIHPRIKCLR